MEIILLVIMIFGIFWIGYLAVDRCGRFTDKNYKEIDSSAANHSVLVINQAKTCGCDQKHQRYEGISQGHTENV